MTSRGDVKHYNASKTHQKIDTGGDNDEEEVFEGFELDSAVDVTQFTSTPGECGATTMMWSEGNDVPLISICSRYSSLS